MWKTTRAKIFADDSFAAPAPPARNSLGDSVRDTMRRFHTGQSVEQIAETEFDPGHNHGHLTEAIERASRLKLKRFFTDNGATEDCGGV